MVIPRNLIGLLVMKGMDWLAMDKVGSKDLPDEDLIPKL